MSSKVEILSRSHWMPHDDVIGQKDLNWFELEKQIGPHACLILSFLWQKPSGWFLSRCEWASCDWTLELVMLDLG